MKDGGENHGDDYYPDFEGKAISIHCLRINASEYFLSVLCVIVTVFQAAQICHYYAVNYISKSLFRFCYMLANMPKHATLNLSWSQKLRNTYMRSNTHTYTHLPSPSGDDILHHRPKHISSLMQYRLQTLDTHTTWSVCACVSNRHVSLD